MQAVWDLAALAADQIELRRVATKDRLTGVLTRLGFDVELVREIKRHKRSGKALSLIAVDLDKFKSINDKNGHLVGDTVLRSITKCIQEGLRPSDIVGRIGGDEFVVAVPETNLAGARIVAERIRRNISAFTIYKDESEISLSASFGLAEYLRDDLSWIDIFARADAALYEAKRHGGDHIERCKPAGGTADRISRKHPHLVRG